jgi:hypothetical protein
MAVNRPIHHSAKKSPLGLKKSVNVHHEIMEIGLICSSLIEKKATESSNPWQNHV